MGSSGKTVRETGIEFTTHRFCLQCVKFGNPCGNASRKFLPIFQIENNNNLDTSKGHEWENNVQAVSKNEFMWKEEKEEEKRKTLRRDRSQERTLSNIPERIGKPREQVEGTGTRNQCAATGKECET